MLNHSGTRFLSRSPILRSAAQGTVFFFIIILAGITGCATHSNVENDSVAPIETTATLSATPNPSATLTATALPTTTMTEHPPTKTATLRPSTTTTSSATPLPQPIIIGYSVADRPLEIYHFGNGPRKRMIIAGIHGGYEWNTIALADQLIAYLNENPKTVPGNITLYILRSANPDGEARDKGSAGRANENGVDVNRNFPGNWAKDWDRRGCWNHLPITAGAYPSSEPEAGAIMRFILTHQIEALISYHSAALGIFAGGIPAHPGSHDLAQTLARVSPYDYPPYDAGCEYTGQLTDWVAIHNIPAVDIELGNHEDTDYSINLKILAAFLAWEY